MKILAPINDGQDIVNKNYVDNLSIVSTVIDGNTIKFLNSNNVVCFTVQLPVYEGATSSYPNANGVSF